MHKYIHILQEFDQLIDNTMSNNITDHSKNSTHTSL